MRIITKKIYKIDEHPDKESCYNWIRENWLGLNEHSVQEVIQSIEALSKKIGGTVKYAISSVPDRGEHITFKDYDHEALCYISAGDCPLTGVCWDITLIEGLRKGNPEAVLQELHKDTEYQYSNQGLLEMCQANGYEFTEEGEIF
jgi:hypothetical protein